MRCKVSRKPLTPQGMGRKGGLARTKKLTKAQLSAIGRLGAKARWKKKDYFTKGERAFMDKLRDSVPGLKSKKP